MNSAINACGCGCSPCVCTTSTAVGCVADLCVPRPCFFNGQLIGADDLNALVAYFRTKEAMLARFVSGWGVLGGLRLGASAGAQTSALSTQTISPNPQIIVGTVAQISAGAGIDAGGRTLALCSARTVDLATLVVQTVAPSTKDCDTWFQGLDVPNCKSAGDVTQLTANAYWLVAQYIEIPARPAPQYTGGGPCDPAPSCNYSRRIEDIQLSLVASLPPSYFLTGCLDAITLSLQTAIALPSQVTTPPGTLLTPPLFSNVGGQDPGQFSNVDCVYQRYQLMDAINAQLAEACCTTPALVLGQVLFTSNPGNLQRNLPNAPMYTILLDAYPFRRVIAPAALDLYALAELSCQQNVQVPAGPGVVVASGIVGVSSPQVPPVSVPYVPAPHTYGALRVYNYDPAVQTDAASQSQTQVAGRIWVTFAGYATPSVNATYVVKAMVVEPQLPFQVNEASPPPPPPTITVAFDSFGANNSGIVLTVIQITTSIGSPTPSVPTPVPVSELAFRFFAIEITEYST